MVGKGSCLREMQDCAKWVTCIEGDGALRRIGPLFVDPAALSDESAGSAGPSAADPALARPIPEACLWNGLPLPFKGPYAAMTQQSHAIA